MSKTEILRARAKYHAFDLDVPMDNVDPHEVLAILARLEAMERQINRLERCLFESIEEGGVGMGWEVQMDHDKGLARPVNDPSEE